MFVIQPSPNDGSFMVTAEKIQPGKLFVAQQDSNPYVALRMEDTKDNFGIAQFQWLQLTGLHRFLIRKAHKASGILLPDTGGANSCLRVDAACERHFGLLNRKAGDLVIDEDGVRYIVATSHPAGEAKLEAVVLHTGQVRVLPDKEKMWGVFDVWALSFIDEEHKWVDIVQQKPR